MEGLLYRSIAGRGLDCGFGEICEEARSVRDVAAEVFGDGLAHISESGADTEIYTRAAAR